MLVKLLSKAFETAQPPQGKTPVHEFEWSAFECFVGILEWKSFLERLSCLECFA